MKYCDLRPFERKQQILKELEDNSKNEGPAPPKLQSTGLKFNAAPVQVFTPNNKTDSGKQQHEM